MTGQTSPTFDGNGNTTRDETNKTYTYDAWIRLASTTVSGRSYGYAYDALGRRTMEGSSPGDVSPAPPATHLYYSAQWQVIEEDTNEDGPDAIATKVQNVWSPAYVDALILRDVTISGGSGVQPPPEGGEEPNVLVDLGVARPVPTVAGRLYVQQDANWNVTALTNTSGTVQQRFIYDPYGTAYARNATTWASTTDAYTFGYLHQGGRLDQVTGLAGFRFRDLNTKIGRWSQCDPLQYPDGLNWYEALRSNPSVNLDPEGTWSFSNWLGKFNKKQLGYLGLTVVIVGGVVIGGFGGLAIYGGLQLAAQYVTWTWVATAAGAAGAGAWIAGGATAGAVGGYIVGNGLFGGFIES